MLAARRAVEQIDRIKAEREEAPAQVNGNLG
jgi:hypothetical protein